MKEHPILFDVKAMRAYLDGRKTQTRRPIKKLGGQIIMHDDGLRVWNPRKEEWQFGPFGQPGDRLWVRETQWVGSGYVTTDPPNVQNEGKVPSIHMRRPDSRITLEVIALRAERVQDISEKDAKAEGVDCMTWINHPEATPSYRVFFHILWDKIYAKRGHGWDANPWVWVIEFPPHERK